MHSKRQSQKEWNVHIPESILHGRFYDQIGSITTEDEGCTHSLVMSGGAAPTRADGEKQGRVVDDISSSVTEEERRLCAHSSSERGSSASRSSEDKEFHGEWEPVNNWLVVYCVGG